MPSTRLRLNTELLRARIPNLTQAARRAGLRVATISNLCTGKTRVEHAEVGTLVALAELAGCRLDDLLVRTSPQAESFAETLHRWAELQEGSWVLDGPQVEQALPEERLALLKRLPRTRTSKPAGPAFTGPHAV